MWVSRKLFSELSRAAIAAENRASELASLRAVTDERSRAHLRELQALESIIADLRTQVAVKNTAFDWLSTSHERIERWYAELMASRLQVQIPTSQFARVSGMPGPGTERPIGEGVAAVDDGAPSSIEELFRQNSGALFDDMGDALAAHENIKTTVYEGAEPTLAEG